MGYHTQAVHRVPGIHGGLQVNDPVTTSREASQDREGMQPLEKCRPDHSEATSPHIIGLLNSTIPAVLPAKMHLRALQRLKNLMHHRWGNWDHPLPLNRKALDDLSFWISRLRQSNGRPIRPPAASTTISSDASRLGWGATCEVISMGGPWTRAESKEHINILEGGVPGVADI